jgi:tetratricopeptide (TPR) repeat protein
MIKHGPLSSSIWVVLSLCLSLCFALPSTGDAQAAKADLTDPTPDNAEAIKLMHAAEILMWKKDLDGAQRQLDDAAKIQPNQAYLWSGRARIDSLRGNNAEAITDYGKELEYHPSESRMVYPEIIQIYNSMGQHKEALAAQLRWAEADSDNPEPIRQLIDTLIDDGDATTAVKEVAAAHLTEVQRKDPNVQVELGRAMLIAGDKTAGTAVLTAVLTSVQKNPDDDPCSCISNDVAYYLADADVELPLADKTARQDVEQTSRETRSWTLEDNSMLLRNRSLDLFNYWDTLGWVLFREDNLDEAFGYINAAWLNNPSSDFGTHLGEVLTAMGDRTRALGAYQLALATIPVVDGQSVRASRLDLLARIDALKKDGVSSGVDDAALQLKSLRRFDLGTHLGGDQSANYRILLKNGNVVKVDPVNPKNTVDADLELIARAKFTLYFPPKEDVQIVHYGTLNCHENRCELILGP